LRAVPVWRVEGITEALRAIPATVSVWRNRPIEGEQLSLGGRHSAAGEVRNDALPVAISVMPGEPGDCRHSWRVPRRQSALERGVKLVISNACRGSVESAIM
jgi:hypothetical protein